MDLQSIFLGDLYKHVACELEEHVDVVWIWKIREKSWFYNIISSGKYNNTFNLVQKLKE